jgi:hypothetical protein
MDDQELTALYGTLLELLRKSAPWAAAQVEETVRQGRPVARQVRRGKKGPETVTLAVASTKLREDQFAATEELTPRERATQALTAVERLLVDPSVIVGATEAVMEYVGVREVLFADPSAERAGAAPAVRPRVSPNQRLAGLLVQVKREVADGR